MSDYEAQAIEIVANELSVTPEWTERVFRRDPPNIMVLQSVNKTALLLEARDLLERCDCDGEIGRAINEFLMRGSGNDNQSATGT